MNDKQHTPPRLINPFHYGGPVPPEYFIGHQQKAKDCHNHLIGLKPKNLAINGERRIGKTSLLHYLLHQGQQADYLGLYLDCAPYTHNINEIWRGILQHLAYRLEDIKSPQIVLTDIKSLLQQKNIKVQDIRTSLRMYYRAYSQQTLILFLDEFEVIFQNYTLATQTFLSHLYALSQDPNNAITIVTATREPLAQVCEKFNTETKREFHGGFVRNTLASFNRDETNKLIETLLINTNIVFTEAELDYIWQTSQWDGGGFSNFCPDCRLYFI